MSKVGRVAGTWCCHDFETKIYSIETVLMAPGFANISNIMKPKTAAFQRRFFEESHGRLCKRVCLELKRLRLSSMRNRNIKWRHFLRKSIIAHRSTASSNAVASVSPAACAMHPAHFPAPPCRGLARITRCLGLCCASGGAVSLVHGVGVTFHCYPSPP